MNTMVTASTYDDIADEYYDAVRHPTCANFFELSANFLVRRVQNYAPAAKAILEVGTGRSIVAPAMAAKELPLSPLTLLDQSPRMLGHSLDWAGRGAKLLIANAVNTGLASASFQLIVSSLGDPYNDASFWQEISRLLAPRGACLFTTPSPEWAERFRARSDPRAAEFFLANGARVLVRSEIPSVARQSEMIGDAGLRLEEMQALDAGQLSGAPSPKLLANGQISRFPVLRGFTVTKK